MTRFERAKAADDVSAATSIREESVRALGAPGVPGSTAKTLRRLLRNLHKWIGSHEAGDVLAPRRARDPRPPHPPHRHHPPRPR
ncbi:hypothetical protein, partial [Kitasatospora sp. NPDC059800]|uniref:hypothetical protein n=1 Tax=Kitasatospora sp. NPDC059800 TaxID=3346951 RepID=UPI00365BA352